ncbi:methyl-accepting chemotaxis sensory transducer [Tamilnaduibacter salinus]|uniref:Methyl-accepting chemotaxis sensory transducer n=1 Tax=Tamilnaduibacter salinus TaxID=1484056 RepID=A0A2U1CTJ5_9GAMM|nr:methyl-accepting chemotaxis protein [Tamilnaduibacter salinus]PVY70030.1 methyl-accepting chemotaxis sensory transducer [Tamilnaduibacter salinus]
MLNQIPIRLRLLVSYAVPLLAVGILTFYGLSSFNQVERGVVSIYDDRVVPLRQLKKISDDYAVLIIDAINKANAGLLTAEEAERGIREAQKDIEKEWSTYVQTKLTEKEADLVREAEQRFDVADREIEKTLDRISGMRGNVEGRLDDFDGPLYQAIDPITAKINELLMVQLEAAGDIRDNTAALHDRTVFVYSMTAVLATIVVLVLGILIGRSIANPILRLRTVINQISKNSDLSLRLNVEGKDEVATTAEAFNQMLEKMEGLVRRLSSATAEVASAAEEMSAVSGQTQTNIAQQAEQTDQVATAMNQMSAASRDVAQSAGEAQSAATNAEELSKDGRRKGQDNQQKLESLSREVSDVASRIRGLAEQSQGIGRVVQVINDIAEQTNLLALNAAIEAARAGEQGRGFAVVADEVRALARRTQESTEEIESLISALQNESDAAVTAMETGQSQVEQSREQVGDVAEVLERISEAIEYITGMGTQIASAAEEQSVAADQVSGNITAIVDMAEQTRTGAGHTAKGSEDLSRLASELQTLVGQFRIS